MSNDFPYELSIREIKVIKLRMNKMTLQEVASEFGVTRERIRQIESKALEKVKYQPFTTMYVTFNQLTEK